MKSEKPEIMAEETMTSRERVLRTMRFEKPDRMAILTDVDRQHLMPRGTRAEIYAYVRHIVELFATPEGA